MDAMHKQEDDVPRGSFESYEGEDERDDPNTLPDGFKFCPTDEEIITHYLRPKVRRQALPCEGFIIEIDVYKHSPMWLSEVYADRAHEGVWYFFTPRNRKYEGGGRPDRAAFHNDSFHGFWKATAADKLIRDREKSQIGTKKSLVFHRTNDRKLDKGTKTNWIMVEYKIEESRQPISHGNRGKSMLDDYVLCKIYRGGRGRRKALQVQPLNQIAYPDRKHDLIPSQIIDQPAEPSNHIPYPSTSSAYFNNNLLQNPPQSLHNQIPYPHMSHNLASQAEPSSSKHYSNAFPELYHSDPFAGISDSLEDPIIPDLPPICDQEDSLWKLLQTYHFNSTIGEQHFIVPADCNMYGYKQSLNYIPTSTLEHDPIRYNMNQRPNNYGMNRLISDSFQPGPSNYNVAAGQPNVAAGQPNYYTDLQFQPGSQGNSDQAAMELMQLQKRRKLMQSHKGS